MRYLRVGKWTPVSKRYPDDEKIGKGVGINGVN